MTVIVESTAGQWVRHVSDDGSELKNMLSLHYRSGGK
jgi:hypothetical protein